MVKKIVYILRTLLYRGFVKLKFHCSLRNQGQHNVCSTTFLVCPANMVNLLDICQRKKIIIFYIPPSFVKKRSFVCLSLVRGWSFRRSVATERHRND